MATKSPERKIYDVLMKATKEGTVPFGYYGPETCRWATQEEMQRLGLRDFPLVHLDEKGTSIAISPKLKPSPYALRMSPSTLMIADKGL